jgi:hypothetical protein
MGRLCVLLIVALVVSPVTADLRHGLSWSKASGQQGGIYPPGRGPKLLGVSGMCYLAEATLAGNDGRLRGWAYRTRTGVSVLALSDWNCAITSREVGASPAVETRRAQAAWHGFAAPAKISADDL